MTNEEFWEHECNKMIEYWYSKETPNMDKMELILKLRRRAEYNRIQNNLSNGMNELSDLIDAELAGVPLENTVHIFFLIENFAKEACKKQRDICWREYIKGKTEKEYTYADCEKIKNAKAPL